MEQRNDVRKHVGGEHFTFEERIPLEALDRALFPGKKAANFSELTNRIGADIAALIIEENLSPYAALIRLRKTDKRSWLRCERTVYYAIDAGLLVHWYAEGGASRDVPCLVSRPLSFSMGDCIMCTLSTNIMTVKEAAGGSSR